MMKRVLILIVALVMLAGISPVSAADTDNKIGLGYQGIFGGDTFNGLSLRGWADTWGFDIAIFEGGLKLDYDNPPGSNFTAAPNQMPVPDLDAEAILIQSTLMFAPEKFTGKNAKFYFGVQLGDALVDEKETDTKVSVWMIQPLIGAEYSFSELPKLGWNWQVGYAFVKAEEDDDMFDATLRGINASAGLHYYFGKKKKKIDKDSDGDGVIDSLDKCPDTPKGVKADKFGCWALRGVLFDFDKWDIKPQASTQLDEVVNVLKMNPDLKIEVQGHTCSMGSDEYNKVLSGKRAKSVMDYLIDKGIDPKRLSSSGYGKSKPVASNDTDEGRALNRRVELQPIQ